jgi:uncharacterized Ntn-hydrolase superfamily protein
MKTVAPQSTCQGNTVIAVAMCGALILLVVLTWGCSAPAVSVQQHGQAVEPKAVGAGLEFNSKISGTFSIVAVDVNTGVCGAAVASKYPAVGKVVPHVRAGVGAFCTQHWHNPEWAELALDLLSKGQLPEQVLSTLLRGDPQRDKRQLAIIDISGRAANRNPAQADPSGIWWGAATGRYYACQGNTLVGPEVIFAMARDYEQTQGSLADRLMAALIAGDCAGGDHRGRLAAGIRVAKKGIAGYWLELYVDESENAVIDLAKKYAALEHEAKGSWRSGRLPFKQRCPTTGR